MSTKTNNEVMLGGFIVLAGGLLGYMAIAVGGFNITTLIVATLGAHGHEAAMQAYDHVNLGVTADTLDRWLRKAGLIVESCRITSRDPRPPYFEGVTALARTATST